MDFLNGGELFTHLRKCRKFDEGRAKFYAAEIVMALECLHKNKIIYRDLKPENILLDTQGHLKITDFGLSKKGDKKTYTFCGTPEYLAPEIIKGSGHDKAVDWWSLGTLLYEMLCGRPPFYSKNRKEMFKLIVEQRPVMKDNFSEDAADILMKLLHPTPSKRLGAGTSDADEIKSHPFFSEIDWDKLYNKQIEPPFRPYITSKQDLSNIDKMFTNEVVKDTPVESNLDFNAKKKNHYGGFTFKDTDMLNGLNKTK